ncbi:hypothetical protein DSC45_18645 [Streptomyces sp. YIM 130001]|uniref:DUF5709 domain-containing protein n=1 Tax=Streptomyces sp. YIM 130001 TaxID=2259644 RepID=UPI000E65256E|nr:DUF5709 domain-containing protein [Streptomyces sp. YIM 130001]RII15325.1 hypothetical protein DSC45_18645 [Streptomyces sp. YIM 130001]
MSENATWGDEVYQPDGSEVQDDAGLLDGSDTLDGPLDGSPLDQGYVPPDRPLAVEHTGVTAAERSRGETLDQRLAEEIPDVAPLDGDGIGDAVDTDGEPLDDEVGDRRAGRLVADAAGLDDEDYPDFASRDLDARDVGIDAGAASAEEAAVHVIGDA